MVRAAFANIRLVNKLASKPGSKTIHFPTNQEVIYFKDLKNDKFVLS